MIDSKVTARCFSSLLIQGLELELLKIARLDNNKGFLNPQFLKKQN